MGWTRETLSQLDLKQVDHLLQPEEGGILKQLIEEAAHQMEKDLDTEHDQRMLAEQGMSEYSDLWIN